jgi:peptidoglycan lytic transglycosylase D
MPPQRLSCAAIFLLLTATACASVPTQSTRDQSSAPPQEKSSSQHAPKGESAAPEAALQPAKESSRVQKLIEAMDDLYNSGLDAHKAGRYDEARDYFDQAVDAALNSDLDIDSDPALKAAYEELLENIDSLEGDLYQEATERGEEAPKEELKDITTYLSPEEAEKEREKVQAAAETVQYNIPVELNDKVLTFIEAFQTRMRGPFEAGIRRSGRYLDMIKKIFEEEGIPTDLAYMAHQESAFKTSAYSRAKAKGLWQFIAPTARKYGLKRDEWVDERSDPEKSTRAAAAYLKDLYAMFGDWHLAMAAYNAGEGKVMRSMARTGAKDFWTLAQNKRALRIETKNYVPAILASVVIDKAPEEYGFFVDPEDGLAYEEVPLDSATDLKVVADCAGTTVENIRLLNPELRTMATPPYREGYTVRIPVGSSQSFQQKYAAVPKGERLRWTQHTVRRGETMAAIAKSYHVSVSSIMSANSLRTSHRLSVGQSLIIPTSAGYTPPPRISRSQMDEESPTYDRGEKVNYKVHRGDTLEKIAAKYRTDVESLRQWNHLSGSSIRPGQRLNLFYSSRAEQPREAESGAPSVPATGEYQVRRGDTLYSIAQRFNMTVDQLRSVNNLGRKYVIKPGDRLRVAPAEGDETATSGGGGHTSNSVIRYRIRPGDTLERIASQHQVQIQDLMKWNNLSSADSIDAGEFLEIHSQ